MHRWGHCIFLHIFCIFCAYLCIFKFAYNGIFIPVHISAYYAFCAYKHIVMHILKMHIYAYLILHILCIFYAYLCMWYFCTYVHNLVLHILHIYAYYAHI